MTFRDVVGDLVALDATSAVLDARSGPVELPLATIAAARLALPSTADELRLEAVAAAGWQPAQTGRVDGWLLRADPAGTARANSVLPLRALGRPLDQALAAARRWYADRGLPLQLSVPTEARRLLDAELGERGWPFSPDVLLMAARLDVLTDLGPPAAVTLSAEPDAGWLAGYRAGRLDSPAGRALLIRHDRVAFASIVHGGRTVAVGRGVVDEGWLGISAVETAESSRRRGLGRAVVAALQRWAREHGATRSYAQVRSEDAAATQFWHALGYWVHHAHRYRTDPDDRRAEPETRAVPNPIAEPTSRTA